MSLSKKPKILSFSLNVILLLTFLLFGFLSIYITTKKANNNLRNEILDHALIGASAINDRQIKSLKGTSEDLQTVDYIYLKKQLASIRKATPNCRFLYLLGRKETGEVFFVADSEPIGSKDKSPAGEIYSEVTSQELLIFSTGKGITLGPTTDRWGTWLSAEVPIYDSQSKRVIAILGMDFDAKNWNWYIMTRAAFPAGILILATILALIAVILISVILKKRETEKRLLKSESTLNVVLDSTADGILAVDSTGNTLYSNSRFSEILQISSTTENQKSTSLLNTLSTKLSDNESLTCRVLEIQNSDNECFDTFELSNGRFIEYLTRPLQKESNQIGRLWSFRDITERKNAEMKIHSLAEMQKTLTKIASTFINVPLDQIDTTINDALQFMGIFMKADRVYIFSYDFSLDIATNTYEWCNEGIKPRIALRQNTPLSMLKFMVDKHIKGEDVYIHDLSSIDIDEQLRSILEEIGIKKLMSVPLIDDGECKGFIGFETIQELKTFGEKELQILHLFAQMLVNLNNRQQTQHQLLTATEKAEAASKAKSEFLANMSHELRTPLNSVIGFTDLLRTTPLNETQQNYVENANISGHTLLGLINDILDFSNLGAGMLDLEPVKTDVIKMLQNSINTVSQSAEKKNLQLLLTIDPDMPRYADIDSNRLKQVLNNLLSNAVKFTEKGEVELKVKFNTLENKRGRLSFSIRDTGIGINDDVKKKLFKAFSQADSSATRKYGGTGLGLIISEMITDKMGSKIQFISTPDIGTTFFFDIVTTVHEEDPLPLEEKRDISKIRGTHSASSKAEENKKAADQENTDSKIRILIVDDVKLNLVLVKAVLTKHIDHVEVLEATNGNQAVDLYAQFPISLIIMDIMMPECDGLEATRRIREIELETKKHVPIIALTAGALKEEQEKCFAAGMDDFMTKPVDPEKTMGLIRRYLRL